ncbi:MAG: FtsX-like permease family protein [Roseibacillus sp.]
MNFSRLLAGRYLNPARSHISAITLISLVGVMLGVAVLIVVLSVHAGFEREVKKLLLGFAPHVAVQEADGFVEDWQGLKERLEKVEGVAGSYALIQDIVLVDAPGYRKPVGFRAIDTEDEGQIEALEQLLDKKGYPDSRADLGLDEYAVISRQLAHELYLSVGDTLEVYASRNFDVVKDAFERTNMDPLQLRMPGELARLRTIAVAGKERDEIPQAELQQFYQEVDSLIAQDAREAEVEFINRALMALGSVDRNEAGDGYPVPAKVWQEVDDSLAAIETLDAEAADMVTLKNLREIVLPKQLKVWGVYGDSQRTPGPQMFIPLPIGQELRGLTSGVQAVAVRLEDPYLSGQAVVDIKADLGPDYSVVPWTKTHEVQFSLMRLEKVMLTLSMSLIGIISSFSIMAVMYTFAIQKKQEIGVMKALGASRNQISWVFIYQGLVVGFFGAVGGVLLALLILWQREKVQIVIGFFGYQPFKEEFHGTSEIPVTYLPGFMVGVAISAWILCGLAALLPALKASKNDAAKSLRNL